MKSALTGLTALIAVVCATSTSVFAHCEIPCGIYGDDTRFAMILEDVQTIEKSMVKIEELSADVKGNINQITRWVNNKEHHADHIREVVTQYFMTQRIKVPADDDAAAQETYTTHLTLLHKMLVTAMKCKQTTAVANARALHDLTHEFKQSYMK